MVRRVWETRSRKEPWRDTMDPAAIKYGRAILALCHVGEGVHASEEHHKKYDGTLIHAALKIPDEENNVYKAMITNNKSVTLKLQGVAPPSLTCFEVLVDVLVDV